MAKTYIVDGNLKHSGTHYKTGDMLELEDVQAAPLLALGRVKLASEQPQEAAPAEKQPDGFPDHTADQKQPAATETTPPAAPEAPAASAPLGQPQTGSVPSSSAPAQPTSEQLAKGTAG